MLPERPASAPDRRPADSGKPAVRATDVPAEIGRRLPCTHCGTPLLFAPSAGSLRCPSCGTSNDAPAVDEAHQLHALEELDYLAWLRHQAGDEPLASPRVVACTACGAQTRLEAHVVAARCPFCASPLVADEAVARRLIQPRALAPFSLDLPGAQGAFRQWLRGLWFAPNALKRSVEQADGVRGVYLPYWTFDARTETDYLGERGDDRQVSERRGGSTVNRTVTDWRPAAGHVTLTFDDVLVVASDSIPQHLARVLGGWQLGKLVPYADDYVAGFTVEAYRTGLEAGFTQARARMDGAIAGAVRRDIGGDHQRVHRLDTQVHDISFKHVLLPVWIASYRFGGKAYRVVVNGQTGALAGDRPYSPWKIAAAVLAALAALIILYAVGGSH